MTKIPFEQATPGNKAHVAELILDGQTNYETLVTTAFVQIQTFLSLLS